MPHDTFTTVMLVLAAIAFGAATVLERSLIAGGLFLWTLIFLVPLIAK